MELLPECSVLSAPACDSGVTAAASSGTVIKTVQLAPARGSARAGTRLWRSHSPQWADLPARPAPALPCLRSLPPRDSPGTGASFLSSFSCRRPRCTNTGLWPGAGTGHHCARWAHKSATGGRAVDRRNRTRSREV